MLNQHDRVGRSQAIDKAQVSWGLGARSRGYPESKRLNIISKPPRDTLEAMALPIVARGLNPIILDSAYPTSTLIIVIGVPVTPGYVKGSLYSPPDLPYFQQI